MDETVPEPSPWMEIAAQLRRIADDAEKLVGQPAPPHFELNIQPWSADDFRGNTPKNRAATIASVDAVALALLGKPAKTKKLSDGSYFHKVSGHRGRVGFSIYQSIADPALIDKDEELERLRARVAELESRDADGYSDLADRLAVDVKPVPDSVRGLAVDETGEFGVVHPATEGLVDETDADQFACCGRGVNEEHRTFCPKYVP